MTKNSSNLNSTPQDENNRVRKNMKNVERNNESIALEGNYASDQDANNRFYRAFEEQFRGPRTSIKDRLKVYLPFVASLLELNQSANAIDLGCGRGEWLELLRDEGFEVRGVDLDHGMLQACRERDLPVTQEEAVNCLKAIDDESLSIVSGFHLAEHIPFGALQELVAEALRVLRQGGLLILETPNPENIVVGTSNFYMDPTHRKPLPPDLLAFLPEFYGFARTKILRLQESIDLASQQDISLLDVLSGVSPDYAVVAQKKAPAKIMKQFNDAFEGDYGITLNDLAQRYSHDVGGRFEGLEICLNSIRSQMDETLISLSQHLEAQGRQRQEAAETAQTLQQQLNEVSAHAAAEQARLELLQPQLERAEHRIDVLERELASSHSQAEEKFTALSHQLETQRQQREEAAEKVQTLQKLLDEASTHAVAEQARMGELTAQLFEKEQALDAQQSELEQLHAHSQWLQNEWNAAKAKIDELNHSSHHWWTMADGLTRELQSVYRSKSWRITWPLRKLMQMLRWFVRLPVRVAVGLVRLPKRTARWFLAKTIAFALRREGLKYRARRWLYRHPKLEAHLRAFARARGLIHGPMPAPSPLIETKVSAESQQELGGSFNKLHLRETLTPRARQIYADLKSSIEKNKQEVV